MSPLRGREAVGGIVSANAHIGRRNRGTSRLSPGFPRFPIPESSPAPVLSLLGDVWGTLIVSGTRQSYLTFRNHAMHAQWNEIESEAVNSVLGFVEQLVLKYFQ